MRISVIDGERKDEVHLLITFSKNRQVILSSPRETDLLMLLLIKLSKNISFYLEKDNRLKRLTNDTLEDVIKSLFSKTKRANLYLPIKSPFDTIVYRFVQYIKENNTNEIEILKSVLLDYVYEQRF